MDLRQLQVLSDTQHMWSSGSVASRMTNFFASKMLRGRIEKLKRDHFPSALANKAFKGNVYKLDDLVINTESLIETLSAPVRDRLGSPTKQARAAAITTATRSLASSRGSTGTL